MTDQPPKEPAPLLEDEQDWQWLDGLAGRPGQGAAHAEGSELRAALGAEARQLGSASATDLEAAWQRIAAQALRTAAAPPSIDSASSQIAPAPAERPEAANQGKWWVARHQIGSLAAVLAMAIALPIWLWKSGGDEQPVSRGFETAAPSDDASVWMAESPEQDARGLADQLRQLGATVSVSPDDRGYLIVVEHTGPQVDEVAAVLAAVKAGLDAKGQAKVKVRAR